MKQVTADALRRILDEVTAAFRDLAAEDVRATRKTDGTLVTRVDLAVDRLLRDRLLALADAAWMSEESAANPSRLSSRWTWIVDPLDGTKELARGVPEYAISIGLVENGVVRAGGVVNPAAGMGAVTGADGAWIQWPARPESAPPPAPSLNAATASISRTETEDGSIAPFVDLVGRVRHVGSVANKLMRVACGVEDLTFSVQPKWEWDLCGGVALLAARGLAFERLDRAPMRFNQPDLRVRSGFVAGPPSLVAQLANQLRARLSRSRVGV